MKKKFKLILVLACAAAACTATACGKANRTKMDDYEDKGYRIFVTYDANGGEFLKRDGVTIVDAFHPDNYTADENDEIHVSLLEPTDPSRPTNSSDKVTLTLSEHFFVGWYQERTLVRNEAGEVVDKDGIALEETKDGKFVYPSENEEDVVPATPAYEYSGYWDFNEDKVTYKLGEKTLKMTLYAGWVPYYEFDYYTKLEGETSFKSTPTATTSFDYKTTNTENSTTADHDTIWLPNWQDGAMNHSHTYANKATYSFPKVADTTFKAAYLDEACTQKLEDTFVHQGSLDPDVDGKLVVTNRVQKIYVELQKGERFRIETAEQLSKNGYEKGYYEILADLTFTDKITWPTAISNGQFSGQFYSSEGNTFKIVNAVATYSVNPQDETVALQGGLFGGVMKDAVIKNVIFENATLDIQMALEQRTETLSFGLFAGFVEDGATVSGVTIGGAVKLGQTDFTSKNELNLLTNSDKAIEGLTKTEIKLQVYGLFDEGENKYYFVVDPETVAIDEKGNVTFDFASGWDRFKDQEVYEF